MGSTRCWSVVVAHVDRCEVGRTALLLEDDLLAAGPSVAGIIEHEPVGHRHGVGRLLLEGGDAEGLVARRGLPRLEAVAVVDGHLDRAVLGGAVDRSVDELRLVQPGDAEVESATAVAEADTGVDSRSGSELVGLVPGVGDELLVDARRRFPRLHVGHEGHRAEDRQDEDEDDDRQRGHTPPRSVLNGHGHGSLPGWLVCDRNCRCRLMVGNEC